MSKYDPLAQNLEQSKKGEVKIAFSEIEEILDALLPPTARKTEAWWANNATGHSQARSWLEAGYKTTEVDLEGETLVFRRSLKIAPAQTASGTPRHHPLFGCLKGTVTIADGVDLTEPAMPEWAQISQDMDLPE